MVDVKSFWRQRATNSDLDDAAVTHPDVWQRWLEITSVKKFLKPNDRVLDVGCGSGFATKQLAPLVQNIVGIDYSAEMIDRARRPSDESPVENVSFSVCDVLDLTPEKFGLFDVAMTFRCLINLSDATAQKKAIDRIASVLKPGGRYIFVEGLAEGRRALNDLRQQTGLESMGEVPYNVDFNEAELLSHLAPRFEIVERLNFGIYDFISRVFHPLLVAPEAPVYNAKINEIAARLAATRQDCGDISRVIFLVLQRKD